MHTGRQRSLPCGRLQRAVVVLVSAGLLSLVTLVTSSAAAVLDFTIDPAQSSLAFDGLVFEAIPVTEQSPGSLLTTVEGSLEVFLTPGVIAFDSGLIDFAEQPGPFEPDGLPADLAGQAILLGRTADGALRDIVAEVEAGLTPLDGSGNFDAGLVIEIVDGTFEFNVPDVFNGIVGMAGIITFNVPTDPGTLDVVGQDFVLTIPLDAMTELTDSNTGLTLQSHFTGQIVAMAPVPEPSAFCLLALGGSLFVMAARRRLRARS